MYAVHHAGKGLDRLMELHEKIVEQHEIRLDNMRTELANAALDRRKGNEKGGQWKRDKGRVPESARGLQKKSPMPGK